MAWCGRLELGGGVLSERALTKAHLEYEHGGTSRRSRPRRRGARGHATPRRCARDFDRFRDHERPRHRKDGRGAALVRPPPQVFREARGVGAITRARPRRRGARGHATARRCRVPTRRRRHAQQRSSCPGAGTTENADVELKMKAWTTMAGTPHPTRSRAFHAGHLFTQRRSHTLSRPCSCNVAKPSSSKPQSPCAQPLCSCVRVPAEQELGLQGFREGKHAGGESAEPCCSP